MVGEHPTLYNVGSHCLGSSYIVSPASQAALDAGINTHSQWASRQYYAHAHKHIAQLCARMSINDILDRDRHVHTYIHHENASFRALR